MTRPSTSLFGASAADRWGRGIRVRRLLGVVVAVAGLVVVAQPPASASAAEYQRTVRVNLSSTGAQAVTDYSSLAEEPAISANNRYVAFADYAKNLVPGDTNDASDVFVRDMSTGTTRRVSVSSTGAQGLGLYGSWDAAISADGCYVAFVSWASNLVPADTNDTSDVFVHDTATGKTRRVSLSSTGAQGLGFDEIGHMAMSADGRHVAFTTYASNMVPGDTNNARDVFVHDTGTGKTRRVSLSNTGAQGNSASGYAGLAISADGRHVTFDSDATNLVPGDTNGTTDVFVRDMATGKTRRVSLSSTGAQGNDAQVDGNRGSRYPAISADGRYITFVSQASNLVPADTNGLSDVFVRDTATGKTQRVSVSSTGAQTDEPYGIWAPAISADGRRIAFTSYATSLVPGDTNDTSDVFVHDTATGKTRRVSLSNTGAQGDNSSFGAGISPDGRHVGFRSEASNLVAGDTNQSGDLFLRHLAG